MADLTFDAVIVGGGNKGLLLAMYLMKYGGMSVGILERRHEMGGCLATEERSAPGFRGNTAASIILSVLSTHMAGFPDLEFEAVDQHFAVTGSSSGTTRPLRHLQHEV
jgi:phytoene dehydrogenase-like protein